VFAAEVQDHRRGRCTAPPAGLPLPVAAAGRSRRGSAARLKVAR
jgi:hypothetical protein